MRTQQQILKDIEDFRPVDDNWLPLDDLLAELWHGRIDASCFRTLFGVFERYPEEHGGGVLWSILHGIESMDIDYEDELRQSLSRQPSHMAEVMLRRLEKSKGS